MKKKSSKKSMLARLRKNAKKGGQAVVEKRGKDYMREIGSRGGKKTWAKENAQDPVS
jgi:general stress protein YciG